MTNTPLFKFTRGSDFVIWRKNAGCAGSLDVRFCEYSTLEFFTEVFEFWRAFNKNRQYGNTFWQYDLNPYIAHGEGDFVDWLHQQNPPFEIEYIGPKMEPNNDPPGVVY